MKKGYLAELFEAEEKLLKSTKDEKTIKRINKFRQHRKISKLGLWIIGVDLLIQLCFWAIGIEPITAMMYIHYLICITVPCLSFYFYRYSKNEYKKQIEYLGYN